MVCGAEVGGEGGGISLRETELQLCKQTPSAADTYPAPSAKNGTVLYVCASL